jgi:hypothetical protein
MTNHEKRIEEIVSEIERLQGIITEKKEKWNKILDEKYPSDDLAEYQKTLNKRNLENEYEEYCQFLEPESSQMENLNRELRMIMPFEVSPLPDYGHVMSLKNFIEDCECGNFIDYDGHGSYISNGQRTNITVYPSDVKNGKIRKEFDSIIWFNK